MVAMATKSKLEYIWLDGYEPTQSMRSKTMVVSDFSGNLEDCKMWSLMAAPQSRQRAVLPIAS